MMRPLRRRITGLIFRTRRQLLLAAVTGLLVGLGVAAFEWVTREQLYDRLRHRTACRAGWRTTCRFCPCCALTSIPRPAGDAVDGRRIHPELPRSRRTVGPETGPRTDRGRRCDTRVRWGTRIRGAVALSRRGDRLRTASTLAPMVLALRYQGLDGRRSGGRRGGHLQDAGHRCDLRPRGSVPGRHRAPHAPARAHCRRHELLDVRDHRRHHPAVPGEREPTLRPA